MMNPMQMVQLIRGNPQSFVQQMADSPQIANNPVARNALDMMRRNDSAGLQKMAENLCRERGVSPDMVKQQLMAQFGMR